MQNHINALLCTIAEKPEGAPAGVLYSAMQTVGWGITDWGMAIHLCMKTGLISSCGDIIRPTQKLMDIVNKLKIAA